MKLVSQCQLVVGILFVFMERDKQKSVAVPSVVLIRALEAQKVASSGLSAANMEGSKSFPFKNIILYYKIIITL